MQTIYYLCCPLGAGIGYLLSIDFGLRPISYRDLAGIVRVLGGHRRFTRESLTLIADTSISDFVEVATSEVAGA